MQDKRRQAAAQTVITRAKTLNPGNRNNGTFAAAGALRRIATTEAEWELVVGQLLDVLPYARDFTRAEATRTVNSAAKVPLGSWQPTSRMRTTHPPVLTRPLGDTRALLANKVFRKDGAVALDWRYPAGAPPSKQKQHIQVVPDSDNEQPLWALYDEGCEYYINVPGVSG
jgi:hypothetical protein